MGDDCPRVTQYFRNLRGGSQPILARASDGLLYVVKFNNNPQGANLAFNEAVGTELYRACELPVPAWKPLLVTYSFINENPDCWIQTRDGCYKPEPGLCFASRLLDGDGACLYEFLPGTSFNRITNRKDFWLAWLIDICAGHSDSRQALFLQQSDGWLKAYFIDHGHLFGGPNGKEFKNFKGSRHLDTRVYLSLSIEELQEIQAVALSLNSKELRKKAQTLPDSWKTKSALDQFEICLSRLANPRLLQNLVDTMIDAHQKDCELLSHGSDIRERERAGKPPMAVLYSGVQAAALQRPRVGGGVDRFDRAQG